MARQMTAIVGKWVRKLVIAAVFIALPPPLAAAVAVPIAAPSLTTPPVPSGLPLEVRIGLFISNLAAIHEAAQTFDLDAYLALSWNDPRLAHAANEGLVARTLKPGAVWTPPLDFSNAYQPVSILSSSITVQPSGEVVWIQRFTANLSTELWLHEFPFDHQRLEIVIQSSVDDGPETHFVEDTRNTGISEEGYVGLAEWRTDRVSMTSGRALLLGHGQPSAKATFLLEITRRPAFYVWKGFLPILLIIAISFSVFWIDEDQFDWQAKIVITMMLSLVAFSFALAGVLPRLSYLTFFDGVFLSGFIFEFLVMVELVVVRTFVRQGRSDRAAMVHWHSRYVYPLALVGVVGLTVAHFF